MFVILFISSLSLQGQRLLPENVYRDSIKYSKSDSVKGWAYTQLARTYTFQDVDKASSYVDSAEMFKEFTVVPEAAALVKYTRANVLRRLSKYDESVTLMNEAISTFQESDNNYMLATIHYNLGTLFLDKGDDIDALNTYLKGLEYCRKLENPSLVAHYLNTIGHCQKRYKDYQSARNYYSEALNIYRKQGHINGQATTLMSLGAIEHLEKDLDTSLEHYEEALELVLKEKPYKARREAIVHSNLLSIYTEVNMVQKALEHGKKAYELIDNELKGDANFLVHINLAKNYIELENFKKGAFHLGEANKFMIDDNHRHLLELKLTKSLLEYQKGNFKSAYHLLENSQEHKDSVYNSSLLTQKSELNIKFETERRESEITRLSLEDELNQSRISRQRMALGGSAIGLSLLSFLLYRLFSQNKKIDTQNQVISKALSEKETLLKEIHHRVKNNLQIISSLLRIQSNQTEDEAALDALKEGQSRVEAMSLIHEDLYQHDDLKAINIKTYLIKLTESITRTYNVKSLEVDLIHDIQEIELDIDTVVPLGLIINELITNSIKYAFPDKSRGQIKLSLSKTETDLNIQLEDDGVGVSQSRTNSGFGSGLIKSLISKLEGQLTTRNDNGFSVHLTIPI